MLARRRLHERAVRLEPARRRRVVQRKLRHRRLEEELLAEALPEDAGRARRRGAEADSRHADSPEPELVAPVNSEVIVLAGLCHEDGYLTTQERIEWSLDNGSVGQFLAPGQRTFRTICTSSKASEDFSNLRNRQFVAARATLTRGTEMPADDVLGAKGQARITVTAASEGTSHITAYAPSASRGHSTATRRRSTGSMANGSSPRRR